MLQFDTKLAAAPPVTNFAIGCPLFQALALQPVIALKRADGDPVEILSAVRLVTGAEPSRASNWSMKLVVITCNLRLFSKAKL